MAAPKAVDAARHDLVVRLKRIEGQLRGLQAMIEAGEDCEAIAQQFSAARKALDKAFYELLACALEHPQFAAAPGENHEERVQRIARTLARFA
jgi:DNA-binding FrmR family transcriptional regulator